MNTQQSQHFLMMGLPNTGKTSFLAALWYLVQCQEVPCSLKLDKRQGNDKYLSQISNDWVNYKDVIHSPTDSETQVTMLLKDEQTGQQLTLHIPDLSGESFRLQWTLRQFTKGYEALLQRASGGILFVNPVVVKPIRIDMVIPLVKAIGDNSAPPAQGAAPPAEVGNSTLLAQKDESLPKWSAQSSPTQVQLVELLQIVSSREHFKPPFRLAIIISAWDTLLLLNESPQEWLNKELPLLRQYLESNRDLFDSSVYGVSAQGCDYKSDNSALQRGLQAKRIQVVGTNVTNVHDLTEPLQWLMR